MLQLQVGRCNSTSISPATFATTPIAPCTQGAGIAGFMPTYKGGYERLYRFLEENVDWPRPSFRTWDPKDLPDWLSIVAKSDSPYFVVTDHELPGFKAATEYRSTINKPVYGYLGDGRSSFRRKRNREASFAYQAVDPATLGPLTDVQLVPASSAQLTFLRNMYLAKGIAHATGIANYLVMLDGKLAGGFIYARDRWDPAGSIYLLVGLLHRARTTAGEADRHARRQQRDDRRLVSAFRGAAQVSAHDGVYRSTRFHEVSRNL